ncbi:CHRD domain-containing protein [Micromonospora phytophila]|uniref:CHRD domain-containing protein n=1 Tax=Micromonospora phytophila TaxID=709888 RepID=UPI00202EDF69|nr:CHRD domain-containing protein [Micromonospora phytophila]MCM0677164.1 CHRD domain-containing protein [Micromonospora phytophila]
MIRRTRFWAVTVAASAALAATAALGTAAMGDGQDDSGDQRGSHDQRDSRDSRGSSDWSDSRHRETVRARLSGYQEDPLTISTPGSGRFVAQIDERDKKIRYRLSYEDLRDVQQAHIHFGGRHQSGGIAAFLCSNLKDAKGGAPKHVPSCPESSGTVEGTIKPDDVVGPADQGIEPGEFDELVDAIQAGVTYVNVHTKKYPNGEIRGQIKSDEDRKKCDEDRDREERDEDRGRDKGGEDRGWNKGDEDWSRAGSGEDRDRDKGDEDWSRAGSGEDRDRDRDRDKCDEDRDREDRDEDRDRDKGDEDRDREDRDEDRGRDKGDDNWGSWSSSDE